MKGGGVARKSLSAIIMRIFSAFSALCMSAAVTNGLGGEEAGRFFLIFAAIQFLSAVSRCGLDNVLLRYCGIEVPDSGYLYAQSVTSKSIVAVTLVGVIFGSIVYIFSDILSVIFFKDAIHSSLFHLVPFGVLGLAFSVIFAMALQGIGRVSSSIFVMNIVGNLCVTVFMLSDIVETAQQVVLVYVISCFGAALLGRVIFSQCVVNNERVPLGWEKLFQSSMPLWVVVILDQASIWAGQMIASIYGGMGEVAHFAVAQRVSMIISFALVAVSMVVAPRFASLFHNGQREDIEKLYKKTTLALFVLAVPLGLFFVVFADVLLSFFGEGFEAASLFLRILVLGQLVYVATGPSGYLLMMSSNEKDVRSALLVSAPVGLLVAMAITPLYGVVGCAIGTAIAVGLQNVIAAFYVKKRFGFGLF